jgi:ATP-dependent protease ClpP protease subunit
MPSTPKRRNISQKSELIYDAHEFGIMLDTREIFISPPLNDNIDEAMIDHVVFHQFLRNLQILNSMGTETILIHMATCGGDWEYGMAMYDAIKNSCDDESLSDIVILSYAHARSMSSIIPQAATWRVMMPTAYYLVHFGEYGDEGNYTNVMANMHWHEKETDIMMEVYLERIREGQFFKREGWDDKQILDWLRTTMSKEQEFYMTARDAVDKGFADAVLGDEGFETIVKLREE